MTGCPSAIFYSEWTRLLTRSRYFGFGALVLFSLALWWNSIVATLALALASDSYTHILLILPLTMGMMFVDLQQAQRSQPRFSPASGGVFLGAALLLHGLATWKLLHSADIQLWVNVVALVLWWSGSVLCCFGREVSRALAFPLVFLLLLAPVPERVVNGMTVFLQHWSAVATEALFRAAHVPVIRDGMFLSLQELDIEVAQECSSIRSSTMLLVTSLLLAHLFLRSWWRQAMFVIAAIPLSIAKNAVRIFTIVELGTKVNPEYFTGELHRSGGFVFFLAAVVLDIALLWWLRKGESKSEGPSTRRLEPKKPVTQG